MATLKKSFYTICYIATIIFLLAFAITTSQKMYNWSGCLLALVFVSLAIAFRGSKMFKGYWYSVVILAVAIVAMYFPQYFKTFGGREASFFIPILLQAIMFGMGTELSLKDFAQVMRMPKGVIVGIVCHYTIMPLVGFAVAHFFNFPGEIAAGIILIGCCPSGLASNVMCYLAKANLALSVSITTVSTLLAPFLTPFLMKLLGGSYITIDLRTMI